MTEWNECLHPHWPEPHGPWLFDTLEIQIEFSMSQPNLTLVLSYNEAYACKQHLQS